MEEEKEKVDEKESEKKQQEFQLQVFVDCYEFVVVATVVVMKEGSTSSLEGRMTLFFIK